ncbi:NAD-dependent malic enzyme 62 kDa isoform, mitochondrial-like [Malus sylvestris]|uniref:NAD-dependent malic enzyme 62 kDa isoform, mitochondrial-like n=1 Tax=Malus sylvestris TaxID=3752 RepID=UPI0021ACDDE7|nr:NAD-dependent malic enzyme 62 kDa isoform, mitochondrial-like [Malus sylvestris]
MSNFNSPIRLSSSVVRHLKRYRVRGSGTNALLPHSRSFTTTEGHRPIIVHKRSLDILHDPWFNKGTSFSFTERDRLDLRGLLPPNVMSTEHQIERFMVDLKRLEEQVRDGPFDPNALAKWRILNRLHDRNETMYYKVLIANIEEYAPIVYTPTVGLVCQNYSGLFRRPRGMYFSAEDRGEMMSMVYNWPADQVDMIVVTDGSRILGLGDLGVQGIGIAIGKLDLYVAAAGINPQRVLPVMIDVGTNNEKLLKDPLYLGLDRHRLDGDEYVAVVDEFMEAVFTRWPNVIVQFEDFQSKWAFKLLQRYRNTYRMFNDDVQGTAGVALAGLLGAVRAQGRSMIDFPKQKIVVAGAGSAGIGVLNAARKTMARMLGNNEDAFHSAGRQFWVVDAKGLITEEREDIDPDARPFARKVKEINRQGLREGASLVEVVNQVNPDVLLGLSAVGGLFSKEVLEALRSSTSTRPAIFAMSNPTTNAECTPEEAFSIVGDNIVFASGSPFKDVNLGNGNIGHCNQGNNMYLFPGIGLGTLLSGSRIVSDGMLQAAAECLAAYMSDEDVLKGIIYPSISSIRDITKEVAAAVIKEAIEEDLAEGYREMDARELRKLSQEEIKEYVLNNMWSPEYPTLVYRNE